MTLMKYFLDTEFIEDGKTIDLISIGIVAEDGREYYAVNSECKFENASNWVWKNVLNPIGIYVSSRFINPSDPSISANTKNTLAYCKTKNAIKEDLLMFFAYEATNTDSFTAIKSAEECYKELEFWGYYADYDWVVFCQLFGTMMDLPNGFPMFCNDLKQEVDRIGVTMLPSQSENEHNALSDAKWNKELYRYLKSYETYEKITI